jgi:hypothetical protein
MIAISRIAFITYILVVVGFLQLLDDLVEAQIDLGQPDPNHPKATFYAEIPKNVQGMSFFCWISII